MYKQAELEGLVNTYAGIGSRQTPPEVLGWMKQLAAYLGRRGCILRTGRVAGADTAFEKGADKVGGPKEIFLPWPGFGNSARFTVRDKKGKEHSPPCSLRPSVESFSIAAKHHPAWQACSPGVQFLHARNCHILLGSDLSSLVSFVICATKDGKVIGGTGQALRLALSHKIPVYNLALPLSREELKARLLALKGA